MIRNKNKKAFCLPVYLSLYLAITASLYSDSGPEESIRCLCQPKPDTKAFKREREREGGKVLRERRNERIKKGRREGRMNGMIEGKKAGIRKGRKE